MLKKTIQKIGIFSFILISAIPISARASKHLFKFSDQKTWSVINKEFTLTKYKGKEALQIKEAEGQGIAYVKDFTFENGIIELDIAALPRFVGVVFRMQSDDVYECIYFRPQNSRHEDPIRRAHTVQYIAHPGYKWYYLRDQFPNQYEGPVDIPPEEWFHVKIEVKDVTARVFVNHSDQPALVVENLKNGPCRGSVGVWCGNTSGGMFANFSVTKLPDSYTASSPVTYTPEQKFLFDTFKNRRSIRKFTSDPVQPEHLLKILDMARTAPTSGNQQPWKFLVIQDRQKLDQLKEACIDRSIERRKQQGMTDPEQLDQVRERITAYYTDYLSAPVYVVVLVDSSSKYPSYNVYDGSLAAGYLMIAARALGYGTVFSQDSVPYELIKEIFEIPDQFERICFTPIGRPETWPEARGKKSLDEFMVFEKFYEGINYTKPIKRTEIPLESDILDQYTGKYQFEQNLLMTIFME